MTYTLIAPARGSSDVGELLDEMQEQFRRGRILGLGVVILRRGQRVTCEATGTCLIHPIAARGGAMKLGDLLALVDHQKEVEQTRS